MGTNTDDWQIQGSDDEKYDPMKKGNGTWCPRPEDIVKVHMKTLYMVQPSSTIIARGVVRNGQSFCIFVVVLAV